MFCSRKYSCWVIVIVIVVLLNLFLNLTSSIRENASLFALLIGDNLTGRLISSVANYHHQEIDTDWYLYHSVVLLEKLGIETSRSNITVIAKLIITKIDAKNPHRERFKKIVSREIKRLRDIEDVKYLPDSQNAWEQIKIENYLNVDKLFFTLWHMMDRNPEQMCSSIYNFAKSLYKNYDSKERYEQALACFQKVKNFNPETPSINSWEGYTFFILEDYENSIKSFNRSIESDPRNHNCYDMIAMSHRFLGNYKEALSYHDQSLALNPDDRNLLEHKSNTLIMLGDKKALNQSIDTLNQISENCRDEQYYTNMAISLRKSGKYGKSIKAHEDAVKTLPDCAKTIYSMAITYWSFKEWSIAIQCCNKAIEINPQHSDSYYLKACCHALQATNYRNESKESLDSLEHAVSLNPEFKERAKNDSDFNSICGYTRFKQLTSD